MGSEPVSLSVKAEIPIEMTKFHFSITPDSVLTKDTPIIFGKNFVEKLEDNYSVHTTPKKPIKGILTKEQTIKIQSSISALLENAENQNTSTSSETYTFVDNQETEPQLPSFKKGAIAKMNNPKDIINYVNLFTKEEEKNILKCNSDLRLSEIPLKRLFLISYADYSNLSAETVIRYLEHVKDKSMPTVNNLISEKMKQIDSNDLNKAINELMDEIDKGNIKLPYRFSVRTYSDTQEDYLTLLSNYSEKEQESILKAIDDFVSYKTDNKFGKKTNILRQLLNLGNKEFKVPANFITEYLKIMSNKIYSSHTKVIEDLKVSVDNTYEATIKNFFNVLEDIKKGYYELEENASNADASSKESSLASWVDNFESESITNKSIELKKLKENPPAAINGKDENGNTGISKAVKRFGMYSIKNLLEAFPEIDLNIPDENSETPILSICTEPHGRYFETYTMLAQNPNVDINVTDSNGDSTLNRVIKHHYFNRIPVLLSRKDLQINAPDNNGNSGFINLCICKGNTTHAIASEFLKRNDLDLNILNKNKRNALMEAIIPRKYSLSESRENTDMHALFYKISDYFSSELAEDQNKNFLFSNTDIGLIKLILTKKGIDLSVRDINGDDVFDLARKYCPEIISLLEEYKANQ